MQALHKTKLGLLAHSRNMLNAAQSQDWTAFSALESQWPLLLEEAVKAFGEQLEPIRAQLLADNRQIQTCIRQAQQALASELQRNTQAASAVKQYLK
jgi:hypothetical protein